MVWICFLHMSFWFFMIWRDVFQLLNLFFLITSHGIWSWYISVAYFKNYFSWTFRRMPGWFLIFIFCCFHVMTLVSSFTFKWIVSFLCLYPSQFWLHFQKFLHSVGLWPISEHCHRSYQWNYDIYKIQVSLSDQRTGKLTNLLHLTNKSFDSWFLDWPNHYKVCV